MFTFYISLKWAIVKFTVWFMELKIDGPWALPASFCVICLMLIEM